MPATNTTATPLGASTLARKWAVDLNTSLTATAAWARLNGISTLTPNFDEGVMTDDSDFDSGGWKSSSKTAAGWSVTGKVWRKRTVADGTAYDPGQEWLRTHSIGKFGGGNRVEVRVYEMNDAAGPKVEAYHGFGSVQWADDGGGNEDWASISFTISGQGQLDQIVHPASTSASVSSGAPVSTGG